MSRDGPWSFFCADNAFLAWRMCAQYLYHVMKHIDTYSFNRELREGKRHLMMHRPDLAMMNFETVVNNTPAESSSRLTAGLYWLAVSFFRLGKDELAIKALATAQKIHRRGIVRESYLMRVNGYGMIRRVTPEIDDFYAYTSIHIAAYLSGKRRNRFDSMDEKDGVMSTVTDAWKTMCGSGILDGKTCSEKLEIFKRRKPVFASFRPNAPGNVRGRIVTGGFGKNSCVDNDARCGCGSGLPYCMCCGRVPGLRELSGG